MFFRKILNHRILVITLFAVITGICLFQLPKLKVNNELDIWIGNNQTEYNVYQEYIRQFGVDESIILLLHSDSIFTTGFLQKLRLLADTIQSVPGVSEVNALTTLSLPVQSLAGYYEVPLVPDEPVNPDRIKRKALKYRILRDHLISADGKTTAIEVQLVDTRQMDVILGAVEEAARKTMSDAAQVVPFGVVPMKSEINRLSTSEAAIFLSLAIVIMLILTWIIFRRFFLSGIMILVAVSSIVWVLGLMAALGITLNILLSSMPLILLVISIAFSVHIIAAATGPGRSDPDRKGAVVQACSHIFRNSLFSAITTIAALLVFTLTPIEPLRHFGLFAGIGVMVAFVISFTVIPVLLSWWNIPQHHLNHSSQWSQVFSFFDRLSARFYKPVFVASGLLLALAVTGILRLEVNTDQKSYLKRDNPLRINTELADQWLSGIVPVELIFHIEEGIYTDFSRYDLKFSEVEDLLAGIPAVKSWQSYRMLADDFFPAEEGFASAFFLTPEVVKESKALRRFVSEDGKTVRITVKTAWITDNQILELVDALETRIGTVMASDSVSVHCTGAMPIFALMGKRLVTSQIQSIALAFLVILGVFMLIYRKPGWSLLAMIPNMLPVAVTLGIMGYLKVPVDVATVLITSVSFGIAVDDTIHFTNTFKRFRLQNPPNRSITLAFGTVGKPLLVTTLLLVSGFIVLAFSSYRPLIFLGLFLSLNLLLALLFDLILLPALLRFRKKL